MIPTTPALNGTELDARPWYQHLNGYHWAVLVLCALGWMFDCADQMMFTISRAISMRDLLPGQSLAEQTRIGSIATTVFMIGWATGGLVFGVVGDKWGRAKTMTLTVAMYAVFTGLSALAHNWWEFSIWRFITGFGVGGEFAAGAGLVADTMPEQARAQALGFLQALSAVGNVIGAELLSVSSTLAHGADHLTWRYLYCFGALPALIAVFAMSRMREPEKWVLAKQAASEGAGQAMGKISDLFSDPRWRRNTLVGLALAISGVVGLWGIGFYSPELIDASFPQMSVAAGHHIEAVVAAPDAAHRTTLIKELKPDDATAYRRLLSRTARHGEVLPPNLADVSLSSERRAELSDLLKSRLTPEQGAQLKSRGSMVQQIGAFFGMLAFAWMATRIGRKPAFVIGFVAAWAGIVIVFLDFHKPDQIYYLYPLLGFCTLIPFGGYAVYFPELFPTRLRTTGIGFCYNVGRYIAALGPITFGSIAALLAGRFAIQGFRLAAVIVAAVYIIGIVAAFIGPETKGQPLPEDQPVAAH